MQMSGEGNNKDENEPLHVRKWTDRILTLVLAEKVIPRPRASLVSIEIQLNKKCPKFVNLL